MSQRKKQCGGKSGLILCLFPFVGCISSFILTFLVGVHLLVSLLTVGCWFWIGPDAVSECTNNRLVFVSEYKLRKLFGGVEVFPKNYKHENCDN